MCKGKYKKFEVEVSFTEYQNNALVTIPDETVMDDFITIFFCCFQLFYWCFIAVCPWLFCNVFLAYRAFSSQSSLGWPSCCPCHNTSPSEDPVALTMPLSRAMGSCTGVTLETLSKQSCQNSTYAEHQSIQNEAVSFREIMTNNHKVNQMSILWQVVWFVKDKDTSDHATGLCL